MKSYVIKANNSGSINYFKVHSMLSGHNLITPNDLVKTSSKDKALTFKEYEEALYFMDMLNKNKDWAQEILSIEEVK